MALLQGIARCARTHTHSHTQIDTHAEALHVGSYFELQVAAATAAACVVRREGHIGARQEMNKF